MRESHSSFSPASARQVLDAQDTSRIHQTSRNFAHVKRLPAATATRAVSPNKNAGSKVGSILKGFIKRKSASKGGVEADDPGIMGEKQQQFWEGALLRNTIPALGAMNVRENAPANTKQETVVYWNVAEAMLDFGAGS